MPGNEGRYVYFEGSDPARPVMRVAKKSDDDGRVRESYPWDRGDSMHMNTSANREGCKCTRYETGRERGGIMLRGEVA